MPLTTKTARLSLRPLSGETCYACLFYWTVGPIHTSWMCMHIILSITQCLGGTSGWLKCCWLSMQMLKPEQSVASHHSCCPYMNKKRTWQNF